MIHHLVVFRLVEDATADDVAELTSALRAVAATVDGLVRYDIGPDLGLRADNDDLGLVATFRDADALHAYLTHPEHLAVLSHWAPRLVAEKHGVQIAG